MSSARRVKKRAQIKAAARQTAEKQPEPEAQPVVVEEPTDDTTSRVTEAKRRSRVERKWDFDQDGATYSYHDVLSPAGFIAGNFDNRPDIRKAEDKTQDDLVYKSAMSVGTAPGKQLFMTAFMLYMAGNTLQIFSIMMLGMALWQPIQRLMSMSSAFSKFAESHVDLSIPKILYGLCNLAGVALALYKVNSMGLLPTSALDWIATPIVPQPTEFSFGSVL